MKLTKQDYENGIKAVEAEIKDATIRLMMGENTLEMLKRKLAEEPVEEKEYIG